MENYISVIQSYYSRKEKEANSIIKKNNKKKTRQEYVEELALKNPTVELVGDYINARTKTQHHCLIHNIYWDTTPSRALQGVGCEYCHKERIIKKHAKNHDQYIAEVYKISPFIDVVETYINASTAINHYCNRHNILWKANPDDILKGQGCVQCGKEKISNKLTKTQEEYISELDIKNPTLEVCEEYINSKIKILHRCTKHNIEWKIAPSSALKGCGCSECKKEKIREARGRTHEQYLNELMKINSNIVPLEQYINSTTPILHECLIDGYVWKASPGNILSGHSCAVCAKNAKRTNEEYIDMLSKVNPNLEPQENYINNSTPILHKCIKHNIVYSVIPSVALTGSGCDICKREKTSKANTKTNEQYQSELYLVNPDIIPIDNYVDIYTPILHKCLRDNYIWLLSPNHALRGRGCPICNESKGERQIRLWLENNNINYTFQKYFDDCRDRESLPFDFYLNDYNKCIEYDGEQHYKAIDYFGGEDAFILRRWHDNIKDQYCDDNNIPLLRIRYDDNIGDKLKEFLSI